MIIITPLIQNDILHDIASLQPEGWGDILPFIDFYTHTPYCFPVKAQLKNELIGTGTAIIYGNTAWLAHIIVVPQHRNKGVGKLITHSLIEIVKSKVCSTVSLLATTLGEPIYRQLGFLIETEYLFFKDGSSSVIPEMPVVSFEENYRQSILDLDFSITGERRGILLNQHLPYAHLVAEDGLLSGCYLPTLGEGFIMASEPTVGLTLLNLKHKTKIRTVLPVDNKIAVDFLIRNGFEAHQKCVRMRLGKSLPSWNPAKIYSRAGGNIG